MPNLATTQIRLDHQHVQTLFHRYKPDTSLRTKEGLVRNICVALEIHAQLEEEIFYPALRDAGIDVDTVAKSVPAHNEMRRLIGELRSMEPGDPAYDKTFMELMRDVMHHVADEETTLLPDAERLLGDRLGDIGKQLTKRRMELVKQHAGEISGSFGEAMPKGALLAAGGALVAGAMFLTRSRGGSHRNGGYRGEYRH